MLNNFFIKAVFVLGVLALASCSNNKNENAVEIPIAVDFKTYLVDSVISFQENKLRNASLCEARKDILKKERSTPTDQDGDYLLFEIKSHPQIDYTVAYTFVNDSLDEMEIKIDSEVPGLSDEILSTLKAGLSKQLSAPSEDQGIIVFTTKDLYGRKCNVSIADNSTLGHSSISLLYYKEK